MNSLAMAINQPSRSAESLRAGVDRATMFLSENQYNILRTAGYVSLVLGLVSATGIIINQIDPSLFHQLATLAGKISQQNPDHSSSVITNSPSCDFQVNASGNSLHAHGTVPVSEVLARNGADFNPTTSRVWVSCGDVSGHVGITRIPGDAGKAVIQNGVTLHTDRLLVSEIIPEYKGLPPHNPVTAMGPCDANINGASATFDCTISK